MIIDYRHTTMCLRDVSLGSTAPRAQGIIQPAWVADSPWSARDLTGDLTVPN